MTVSVPGVFAILVVLGFTALLVWWWNRRSAPAPVPQGRQEPPETAPTPRRRLPTICGNCAHWNHAAGQARLARNPVFAQMVAPYIAPSDYGEEVDEDGNVTHRPDVPLSCEWTDFGLCEKHAEGMWKGCTAEQRMANFPEFTAETGDCFEPREDA